MAEKIPSWIERILLPQLSEIKGDVKALDAKIGAVSAKVDNLESKMDTKFEAVESKMDSKFEAVNGRIDNLESKMGSEFKAVNTRIDSISSQISDLRQSINMAQRLAVVEVELKDLRKKSEG